MLKLIILYICLITIVLARSATTIIKPTIVDSNTSFKQQYSIENNNNINNNNNNNNNNNYNDEEIISKNISDNFPKYWNDLNLIYKTYQQCSKNDTLMCLKLKLATILENTSKSIKDVQLFDGVKFIKDSDDTQIDNLQLSSAAKTINENDILNSLPRSIQDRETALTSMILNKIVTFFQSHTLQIKFPSDLERSLTIEEARKKKKDKGAFIMIPLLLGGTFIPIAYGALALLAGKALIVSKLALVLASIIGIKKLLSNSSGHESSHEVVVSGGGGHGGGGHGESGWGREFDLAYNAYLPKDRTTNHI